MYSFRNDYSEGAHPEVLQALTATNLEQTCGYGMDHHCQEAADLIRSLCAAPQADVHFLVGGTQANLVTITSFLASYESVIAVHSGHINTHETGAVESTGHKVCSIRADDGKLTPALVEAVLAEHNGSEHMVFPRMVYISDSTEVGTIYTRSDLEALRACCDRHGLLLFLDGARLGSALTSPDNDLTLPDLAALTDMFYIGGTKNGVLFGEALVVNTPNAHFRWHMKQRGAILAKGRLLGIQFKALLANGLYFDIARHANEMAFRLRDGMTALGYPFPVASPSNQQFPVLPNTVVSQLQEKGYEFEVDHPVDAEHTCVRFVTSWATAFRHQLGHPCRGSGAVPAGSVRLPVRRPYGIRSGAAVSDRHQLGHPCRGSGAVPAGSVRLPVRRPYGIRSGAAVSDRRTFFRGISSAARYDSTERRAACGRSGTAGIPAPGPRRRY